MTWIEGFVSRGPVELASDHLWLLTQLDLVDTSLEQLPCLFSRDVWVPVFVHRAQGNVNTETIGGIRHFDLSTVRVHPIPVQRYPERNY